MQFSRTYAPLAQTRHEKKIQTHPIFLELIEWRAYTSSPARRHESAHPARDDVSREYCVNV